MSHAATPPPFQRRFENHEGTDFAPGESIAAGWRVVQSQYGVLLGMLATAAGIGMAAGFIPYIGAFAGIFCAPLYSSAGMGFVEAARGRRVTYDDMWSRLRAYWPLVGVNLLVSLASVVVAGPLLAIGLIALFVPLSNDIAVRVLIGAPFLLAGVCVSMFISSRLLFSPFILLDMEDRDRDVIRAIKESWAGTAHHWMGIVGLLFLSAFITALTALMCLVGAFLLGMPIASGALAVAYVALFPRVNVGLRCNYCGYDLTGLRAPACPECGAPPVTPA